MWARLRQCWYHHFPPPRLSYADWVASVPDARGRIPDHRAYVGGLWDDIGLLQFRWLIDQGLQPSQIFLDLACGSLRGGVHLIPYLDQGHYLGLDMSRDAITLGITQELGQQLYETKQPRFVISDTFAVHRFGVRPDVILAQSLFTHLALPDITSCLRALRRGVRPGAVFYATFFDGDPAQNLAVSRYEAVYYYAPQTLLDVGQRIGWRGVHLGDWQHPRGQVMLRYDAH